MKARAQATSDSARVNLTTWLLTAVDELRKEDQRRVLAAATEAIQLALGEPALAWFPVQQAGLRCNHGDADRPRSMDSLMMRIELPLGETDESNPTWTFSVSDAVDSLVADLEGCGEIVHGEYANEGILDVRDGLRALAGRIDAAIARRLLPSADGRGGASNG